MKKLYIILSAMFMALTATAKHEYVDLGLPSGTLWATCNVGADSPEGYGHLINWGETLKLGNYSWESYHFNKSGALERYCLQSEKGYNGLTDNLSVLLPMDDIATVEWGSEWQMPTKGQLEELIDENYTTTEWTNVNGVNGRKITSKSNGNSIFLPAAGERHGYYYSDMNISGYYWSRSLNMSSSTEVYGLKFESRFVKMKGDCPRYYGMTVRPVRVKKIRSNSEYVDLGLPSGTLWATCNIGADNPENNGDFYAWGETEPKTMYSLDNYTCDGYDGSEGSPKELLPEDDAATVNWGSEWQMPNQKQCRELVNEMYTTMEWTTVNGVDGCKITSKSNGNSIFLPAAGRLFGAPSDTDKGHYWARTTADSDVAWYMLLKTNGKNISGYSHTTGFNIRPVRVLEEKEHEYVDLGLPSGTMWATCNVGAYIPEEYGDYFHWGETEQKELFDAYSFTDNPTELLPENDAATANWNSKWRTPSLAQIEELINENYTTTEWTTLNGVNGRKITSKSNGNSIFLPAAGDNYSTDYYGYYWSRSINTSDNEYAWALYFDSDEIAVANQSRKRCFSVRPVFLKEVYTEFDENTGTLTYYYDWQRLYRTGKTEAYIPNYNSTRFNDYNEKVTKAVIDPSMKKAPLTSMKNMFHGNSYIGYVSSVGWTVISYPLPNLTSIEGLENLNTENVTDMSSMFYGCEKLDTLDLSLFNTKKVTNMETMFCRCSSLTSLDLSSFNTEKVSDMSSMFSRCSSLTSLDLSSFNNTYVEDLNYMFSNCHELTTICCTKDWSTCDARSEEMFAGCEKLVGGKGTPWSSSVTDNAYARPDRGEDAPGYFTAKTIKGDVNGDGDVNSGDVVAVYSYIIKGAGSGFAFDSANVNGDSDVNSADVVAIYNIIIGN